MTKIPTTKATPKPATPKPATRPAPRPAAGGVARNAGTGSGCGTAGGRPRPGITVVVVGVGRAAMPTRPDLASLRIPPMARSSTYVAPRLPAFPDNRARAARFVPPGQVALRTPPRQHFIGPVTSTPAQRRAAEARAKAQQATNRIAELDPFAARVNGMANVGGARNPNWQKVGASPLEVVATNVGRGGQLVGAFLTGKHVLHAIEHPSVGSVGMAVVGVAGTVAGVKHPHGHGVVAKTMHGAHRTHQGLQAYETVAQPYVQRR